VDNPIPVDNPNQRKKDGASRGQGQSLTEKPPQEAQGGVWMHGATGGASKGNKNALKHGAFTAEALAFKREIAALARMARETMAAIE
jgi:uncharacterized protein YjcR